ncbi:ATP-binding protein [Streptomyces roseolilacinus]|uniref:Regulatory protein n=1 Tax=Streptomyces roseolilacinus TaxID=66904 RepID=A0A918AXK2_9ACTN|nr:ATP-binding protein [Streptomyces roseolilacinus]GGP89844.1 hypothetical protein GCM10010249_04700 [Streptomyces roseolilacinus]
MPREAAHDALRLVAEPTADAALRGRVPGRDLLPAPRLTDAGRTLRRRGDRHPRRAGARVPPKPSPAGSESGRGPLIVDALADRWGVTEGPVPRGTVRTELVLVPRPGPGPAHTGNRP